MLGETMMGISGFKATMDMVKACGWHAYLEGMAMPQHKDQRPKPYRGP